MTRIVAGSARGRRLRTPTGQRTRPTADRVREALFSALESALGSLEGLRVLDLYAGSGAVGLEAMSRGAGVATLVEGDRRTARRVQQNADDLGFRRAEVVAAPVEKAVALPPRAPYDVAFLDPPYALGDPDLSRVLDSLAGNGWLTRGAIVVVERSSRGDEPGWPPGITGERHKEYGETMLWYATAD